MVIGIVGSDDRAVAIARMLRHCGHTVSFSDPLGGIRAERAAAALGEGTTADTTYNQAATCEMLVFAMHWEEVDKALAQLGDYKDGVVIDAVRPPKLEGHVNAAQLLEQKLDNRHVVKAFVEDPTDDGEVRVASDDPEARDLVCGIVSACGGKAIDLGPLSEATQIEKAFAETTHVIRGTV